MEEQDGRPHRCTTIVSYAWKIFTCLFTHVMLVTAVVAYCILGAYMFERLEMEQETKVRANATMVRKNTVNALWNITQKSLVLFQDNWTMDAVNCLKHFETQIVQNMKVNGWDGSDEDKPLRWTFHGALFYSIVVITTIGYGHIAPKTDYGKVATIFYAIMGIPLMLLCLSNIGDIMANSFRFLYWRICCYACTQPPKRRHSAHRRGRSVRSNVQTHRSSGRSRNSSLRQHGPRGSTRSADSALALSEITHSYSDTECRYDDAEEGVAGQRPQGLPGKRPPYGGARHSEPRSGGGMGRGGGTAAVGSWDFKQHSTKSNQAAPANKDEQNTPVLFNKYALDREESCRAHAKNGVPVAAMRMTRRGQSADRGPGGAVAREVRAKTAEPCPRYETDHLTVVNMPQRSSSLRHTYPGRRQAHEYHGKERERSYSHTRHSSYRDNYDYDYDMYADNYTEETNVVKPVPIWLCVFLVISYIIGGAFLFHHWEKGWSFAESAYFCFITLTTIGFGDYVPAQRPNQAEAEVSIAQCSLYLLFGIALLAMSFNLVQEEVINNVKSVARNLGIIKDESDDDEY